MSDLKLTPPELREAAQNAVENLLPQKSKFRYEKAYITFKNWCTLKSVQNMNSESVLLSYFSEMAKDKKASTLWATYSMLRTTLNIRENFDISKFSKLISYLKRQNVGYKPKKSSVFTKTNIDNFLKNAPIDFLPQKVAVIIGISGACRSDELFKMKIEDIDFLENKVSVTIADTKTYRPRSFIVTNLEWIGILKQYVNLRININNNRLFLQWRYNKITNQPFGHNSIAGFPKKIATFLNLNNADTYTGHCFRRTSATLLANTGGDVFQLKRLGGWKSSAVAEGYVENSIDGQIKIAQMISTTTDIHGQGPSSASCPSTSTSCPSTSTSCPSTSTCSSTSTFCPLTSTSCPSTSTSCPSTSTQQLKFNEHGVSLTINSYNQSNVTININNYDTKN